MPGANTTRPGEITVATAPAYYGTWQEEQVMGERQVRTQTALVRNAVMATAMVLAASTAVAAGKGGGKGGGGNGDDGSGEVLVTTTFDCPSGSGCPLSTWQADGPDAYVDGDLRVKSRFNSAGGYVLTMHDRQNEIGTRKVLWNLGFADSSVYGSVPGGADFQTTTQLEDDLGREHKTVIQAGKHTAGVDLGALQTSGDSVAVDMLFDLLYFGDRKRDNGMVSVRFAGDIAPDQCPDMATGHATVTLTDDGTPRVWEIRVPDGSLGCVYNSATNSFTHVAMFGALTLTLVEDTN
jgi:hypothetical protein